MISSSFLTLFTYQALACTNDSYQVNAGTSMVINECGTCKMVTNNGTKAIFVPTKTNTEWTDFYTNVNANTAGKVVINSYPLDTVAAPVAAYSLRKISSTYAGALIRVRRSSDNTEQDISATGGCGFLDTTALLTFVGAGNGFIKTWYDQSGNARNATQATTASQPQIVAAGVVETKFSQTTILFNGSTVIPGVALGIASTSSWSYTMALGSTTLVSGAANSSTGTYFLDRTTASTPINSLKDVGGVYCLQKRNDAGGGLACVSSTTSISTAAVQSVYVERNYNSSYKVYLNNSNEANVAESDGALTPPAPDIGRHTSATTASNFGMYEFVYWGSALSSTDRTTIYDWQKAALGF